MGGTFHEYFDLLDKLGRELERLTAIEQRKTAAVRHDDLMGVNECMRQEQAVSLSLRNLENQRLSMLKKLRLENKKLASLAEDCPPDVRLEARQAAEQLRNRYTVYRAAAKVARTTLECNLHEIEKIIEREGGSPDEPHKWSADIRA